MVAKPLEKAGWAITGKAQVFTEEAAAAIRAWQVPAQEIVDNGYNMPLSGLGLIEPEAILASVAAQEERVLGRIADMRELPAGGNGL